MSSRRLTRLVRRTVVIMRVVRTVGSETADALVKELMKICVSLGIRTRGRIRMMLTSVTRVMLLWDLVRQCLSSVSVFGGWLFSWNLGFGAILRMTLANVLLNLLVS